MKNSALALIMLALLAAALGTPADVTRHDPDVPPTSDLGPPDLTPGGPSHDPSEDPSDYPSEYPSDNPRDGPSDGPGDVQVNVCFALDAAASPGAAQYGTLVRALHRVVDEVSKYMPDTRYSGVTYAAAGNVFSQLTQDAQVFKDRMPRAAGSDVNRASGSGLLKCYDLLKQHSGENVVMLVQYDPDNTDGVAPLVSFILKQSRMAVVTLGVTKDAGLVEVLRKVASKPDLAFVARDARDLLDNHVGTVAEGIRDAVQASALFAGI